MMLHEAARRKVVGESVNMIILSLRDCKDTKK